jgi:hypothetical protein
MKTNQLVTSKFPTASWRPPPDPARKSPEPAVTGLGARHSGNEQLNLTSALVDLQARRLRRLFGLSGSLAVTVAELAFANGCPR